MTHRTFFRNEVFEAQKNKHLGTVSMNTPPHYRWFCYGFLLLMGLLGAIMALGKFSEKSLVKGYLDSTPGMIRIYSSREGVILKNLVQQGSNIKQGDKLFLVDTSDKSPFAPDRVTRQFKKRKSVLQQELSYQRDHLEALASLQKKHFISATLYHAESNKLKAVQQQLNQLIVERLQYLRSKHYWIYAPKDGYVSSILTTEGQFTRRDKPLLKLLPKEAKLVVTLFVPARQAGFLEKGAIVKVGYDAYPSLYFGTNTAIIEEISQSIVTDAEEEKPLNIGEPYYKVIARIVQPSLRINGKMKVIQHGMTLTGVILGQKRSVLQHIFSPLYHFFGENW